MTGTPSRWLAAGALGCAVLVTATALGGIFLPSTYARETASWAAQGVGQDWVNLLLVVPWLVVCGVTPPPSPQRSCGAACGAGAASGWP